MKKTTYRIAKMDCPSEENLIRMKLGNVSGISTLQFDIPNRTLEVVHSGDEHPILAALETLKLDSSLVASIDHVGEEIIQDHSAERKLLWQVLGINFSFFLIEVVAGYIGNSMGLVADGLDMFADSIVYGLALFAVGSTVHKKKQIAKISGYFQLLLALIGFTDVLRRFLGYEHQPAFGMMIIISVFALIGNALSLYLLQKSKSEDAHMKASMIFTSNDVIVNIGVIIAGVLVYLTNTKYPDLIVGAIVFFLVGKGAFRILQLAK